MIARAKYHVKRFLSDRFVAVNMAATLVLHIAIWAYLIINARVFSENVFLHYSVGVGVDYVAERSAVFSLPLVALAILVINSAYACLMHATAKATAYLMVSLTTLAHLCIAIAAILVVSLNV